MELSRLYGSIPKNIKGCMLKNGPKPIKNIKYNHPFDGHGCINKFHFENDRILYSSIYIETDEYKKEHSSCKQLYRTLGTNLNQTDILNTNINNFSNISLIFYNNKLYSLFEGGLPWEIDYINNKTIKKESFNNPLLEKLSNNLYIPTSAHPKIYENELYNISGFLYGLTIYTDQEIKRTILFKKNENYYFHDFKITKTFYVIYLNRITVDLFDSIVISKKTILESIHFKNGNKLLLINKYTFKEYWINMPIVYDKPVMHMGYIKEIKDKIIIDMSIIINKFDIGNIEDPYSFDNLNLTRCIVDLEHMEVKCKKTNVYGDMPVKLNDKYYILINKNDIIVYNTHNLIYKKLYINCIKLEEPVVYEGYIILIAHYKNNTMIYILNKELEIISMNILKQEIHHGFHGLFIP